MKKTISIGLLVLSFTMLPAIGHAQGDCMAKFKAETDPIREQLKALDKQSADLSKRKSAAETSEEQEALLQEGNALQEKRKSLTQQGDEAAKRATRCMGMPTTKEEAQKREWQSKATPYKNKPVDGSNNSAGLNVTTQGLIAMPSIPDTASAPPTPSSSSLPQSDSGKTPEQRAAALAAVNAELSRMPLILPKKETAPSKNDILKMANSRNASARKNFLPNDLSAYSRVVTWIPRFDGLSVDAKKARELSLIVSSATNYFNKPQFITALASAVFSLDPQSTAAANNFASAIVTAGERLYPGPTQVKDLASYRNDAEACFLYAMAISMKGDAWTDESLTSILNLGNLYIDMGKLEEARSLFQVARKQSPFSWDAALGMAAYFCAVNKPDKAAAILEDDNLDKPQTLMVAKKAAKTLEKEKDDIPLDSPEQVYEAHIEAADSAPIATAADFMSQIDQSERNKMRYFVENLPTKGSFTAPSIKKLTQYASVKAIASPQGISALRDFMQMLQIYSITSVASSGAEQLKMLSRLGLNVTGIDLNDVARNPQKYANQKNPPKPKIDKKELMANLENLRKQAETAKRDLATGKTASTIAMAAHLDPFFAILQLDPQDYADPMNVIIQKHNFAVHNRKFNLYNGYLYSVNHRTALAFNEIIANYRRKIIEAEKTQAAELAKLEKSSAKGVELLLLKHGVHVQYFNTCNAAAESAFGSGTNVATVAYVRNIKPKAEAFYYDVIRHVALISDPEVRDRKDAELRRAIYSALMTALNTVGVAHGSFNYHPEWECGCDVKELLRQKEQEEEAKRDEENARIMRNKAAKLAFDSGEIPQSTPLWKRLDAYGFDFDYIFFKGRMSCARTVVKFKMTVPFVPGSPQIFASQEISEFTGAGKYDQGIKVGIKAGEGVKAYVSLSSSVTTNGEGVVKDYSVTAATGLSVSGKGTTASVGGQLTFGPNGVGDSDFSAGISRDFSNEMGGAGNVSFEASTKRGCTLSGKVEQTLESAQKFIDEAKTKAIGKDAAKLIPTDDFLQKELWSGKYESNKR